MCRERLLDYFKAKLESEQEHEQEHKEVCTKIKNIRARSQIIPWRISNYLIGSI